MPEISEIDNLVGEQELDYIPSSHNSSMSDVGIVILVLHNLIVGVIYLMFNTGKN